jgi:hypothetical protein
MSENPVHTDIQTEFPNGTRLDLYARVNSEYPGGYTYRFAYFDPENGNILRYDNSRVSRHDAGVHHRHEGDQEPTSIPFTDIDSHLATFRREVRQLHEQD